MENRKSSEDKKMLIKVFLFVITFMAMILVFPLYVSMVRENISSNEGEALKTLRMIAATQWLFKTNGIIDKDQDGIGEYGYFEQISGIFHDSNIKIIRKPFEHGDAEITKLALLSESFTKNRVRKGIYESNGYYFAIFLPGTDWDDERLSMENAKKPDMINAREHNWACYAWPKKWRRTGIRAMVIDCDMEYVSAANHDGKCDGLNKIPKVTDAMDGELGATYINFSRLAAASEGIGGNIWAPT